jgi:hypothetical protein
MNDEINFYVGYNEEKGKSHERFLRIEDFIFKVSW